MLNVISHIELANFEQVAPPKVEKSNFSLSFSLLPKEERNAIKSIYAFCSYIDDIVDCLPNSLTNVIEIKQERLAWWENVLDDIYNHNINNPLILPFIAVIHRFSIPKQYFLTLIDGCRRDLIQKRYRTFDDLKDYCYSVASVVGLISIEIFGYKYEETKNYAINLGYALQLTNILRDIKQDKDRGFIYLPLEDLEKYGYSEQELIDEVYNDNFVELMRFEAQRAREYYHKARKSLSPDERLTTFSAGIMDEIYYRLLDKIELLEFKVFGEKIRVSNTHKLMITIKQWLSLIMFIRPMKKK
jgi:phytoene synthase